MEKPDYQAMIDGGIIKTVRDSQYVSQYYRSDDTTEKRLAAKAVCGYHSWGRYGEVETRLTPCAHMNFLISNGYVERIDGSRRPLPCHRRTRESVITNKLAQALHVSLNGILSIKSRKTIKNNLASPGSEGARGLSSVSRRQKLLVPKQRWLPNTYYVAKDTASLKMNLESREAALKWAQDAAAGAQADGQKKQFPPAANISADGDYRQGRDVGGQDLDTAALRAAEFGNWMSQMTGRHHNMGFDALKL